MAEGNVAHIVSMEERTSSLIEACCALLMVPYDLDNGMPSLVPTSKAKIGMLMSLEESFWFMFWLLPLRRSTRLSRHFKVSVGKIPPPCGLCDIISPDVLYCGKFRSADSMPRNF